MARNVRRLILWLLAGCAALLVLVALALAALWFFIDPNDYRSQIEVRAAAAIGRPLHLTGALHWQLGTRVFIVSDGGDVANAPGFGAEPLASWSKLRLGVALRPLFDRQVHIDRIEIDGLRLNLQRDAAGAVNWQLTAANRTAESDASPVALQVNAVALHDAVLRYQDAATSADWLASSVDFSADLPADLAAAAKQFRDVELAGRIAGGPLVAEGVPFALQLATVDFSPDRLVVPAFKGKWLDAEFSGGIDATLGAAPTAQGTLDLTAPSLRAVLASVRTTPPPMQDPTTLGALRFAASFQYSNGGAVLRNLAAKLDDTSLTGELSLPTFSPLAIRFDLAADRVAVDRYMEPADLQSEPFELPLAALKELDARGVLRIQQATLLGAAAKELRIDVE